MLPDRVTGESGRFAPRDPLWMDFSKFATGSVSLNGTDLDVDDGGFTLALALDWM